MHKRIIGTVTAIALAATLAAPAFAQQWQGDTERAKSLVAAKYKSAGSVAPDITDTGRTFQAGGVWWRVYEVKWSTGGFRHVAVHRQANGEYLAIEGLEQSRKWSQGTPIGR